MSFIPESLLKMRIGLIVKSLVLREPKDSFWFKYVPTIFAISRKKGLTSKWTILKYGTDIHRNVCLSVILEFFLSSLSLSVARLQPTSYNNLCRDLKNLLKITYFIQEYPKVAGFWISRLFL